MSDPASTIEPRDRLLEATHAALGREIHPGNTVTFAVEVDLTAIEASRASAAESGGLTPSYTAFVVKAVALALREFPYANRRVVRRWFPIPGPRLQKFHRVDVAVAVADDAPGAEFQAVVDIVRDAERLSPAEITAALVEPTTVRHGHGFTRPPSDPGRWFERRGGAALVIAAGNEGIDGLIGPWSYPLGVAIGRVEPRPVVRDGAVVVRVSCTLTLNFDRRVMAGAQAARFFRRVVDGLECPETEPAALATPARER